MESNLDGRRGTARLVIALATLAGLACVPSAAGKRVLTGDASTTEPAPTDTGSHQPDSTASSDAAAADTPARRDATPEDATLSLDASPSDVVAADASEPEAGLPTDARALDASAGGDAGATDAVLLDALPPSPDSGPMVTQLSETAVDHGGALLISGVRFGSRDLPIGRLIFDDATGTAPGDRWDFSDCGTRAPQFATAYRRPAEVQHANGAFGGPATPHPRIERYICGANFGGQVSTCVGMNDQQDEHDTYISFYMRIDPSYHFIPGSDHNFKEYDWAIGYGYFGDQGHQFYSGMGDVADAQIFTSFNYLEFNCPNGQQWCNSLSVRGVNPATNNWYPDVGTIFSRIAVASPGRDWIKIEYQLRHNDPVNGVHKVWVNNELTWEVYLDDDVTPESTAARAETVFGGYRRDYGTTEEFKDNWVYYSQAYYDRTWARVVIADRSDYAAATIVEPQPLTAWSDGEVGVHVNLGRLPGGSTGYVFVFDAAGNRSAVGLPIQLR
ncbi:MAG: hypothetical protein IT384_04095 [Deltaproteobacteria bacterium]|nr:hypothetical protein [Deltaproteobacteria bacterium]